MSHHHKLNLDERILIRVHYELGRSIRFIGRTINRAASTVSRELRRIGGCAKDYTVEAAEKQARGLRGKARVSRKLSCPVLWGRVEAGLRAGWSPEQISKTLKKEGVETPQVSPETIYKAIYVHPRGEVRRELIGLLRQRHSVRKPRKRGQAASHAIPNMQSIHIRPPEVDERQVPGHWEGDLIKGPHNRSSIGTLVERVTGFVVLTKMPSASAADALESFGSALETVPACVRKTMTYDQGREMAYHQALTERTGVAVYFADPHAPWQRGSNENTNGLLRQYFPKGTDLSIYSQDDLNKVAYSLNTRPRKRLDFRTPLDVYTELIALDQAAVGPLQ